MTEEQESPAVEQEAEQNPESAPDVTGENVHFEDGVAGSVAAQQDASVTDSAVGGVAAGRDAQVTNSLVLGTAVGRDLTMTNSLTGMAQVGGNIEMSNSVAMTAAGQHVTVQNSSVGVALSREISLGEGARVMFTTRQAVAFGAAFGVVFAVISRILRRR